MSRRHYFAIGAIAGTTLFCEIALTRLFSVVQYYHAAFLAISLGLFGFAVSGVFVALRAQRLNRERLDSAIGFYGLLHPAVARRLVPRRVHAHLAPVHRDAPQLREPRGPHRLTKHLRKVLPVTPPEAVDRPEARIQTAREIPEPQVPAHPPSDLAVAVHAFHRSEQPQLQQHPGRMGVFPQRRVARLEAQ